MDEIKKVYLEEIDEYVSVKNDGTCIYHYGMKLHISKDCGNENYKNIFFLNNKKFYVDKIVAKAFLTSPEPKNYTVIHIDGNNHNNHYMNLKWGNNSKSKLSSQEKSEIAKMIKEKIPYQTIREKYKISFSTIYRIRKDIKIINKPRVKNNKIIIDKIRELSKKFNKKEIANQLNIGHTTVYRICKANNIIPYHIYYKREILKLLKTKSAKEVSKHFNLHINTINTIKNKYK